MRTSGPVPFGREYSLPVEADLFLLDYPYFAL